MFSQQPKQSRYFDWKIVRGDQVQVIAGKDKGRLGEIVKVIRKENAVVVRGVNMKFRHVS
jgi:large subunit ribosomal protein L24